MSTRDFLNGLPGHKLLGAAALACTYLSPPPPNALLLSSDAPPLSKTPMLLLSPRLHCQM
eukprot:767092-Hanusia_phi.AAC.7